MSDENILPVSSETNPKKLAGAVAARLQDDNVTLSAIGQASTHRLVLALVTLAEWGHAPTCTFRHVSTSVGTKIFCTVQQYGPQTITIE